MKNSTKTLTGKTVTVTGLPLMNGATAPEFTTVVLSSCFYLDKGVNMVEVRVPNNGNRTIGIEYVTAVN